MTRRLAAAAALFFLMVEGAGYYIAHGSGNGSTASKPKGISALRAKNMSLRGRLEGYAPKGTYIVVDTAENRLYLKTGGKTLREVVVSCGSGSVLEDRKGGRKWVFDTPRGVYSVKMKLVKPEWIRPDWAFIEEGEAIPKTFKERIEPGVLGDYALGFGNGFFIHGTLYTRLLGRNVTHGCIRVGDGDLKALFDSAPPGAKIIIF